RRPQIRAGIAMTVETPAHRHRRRLRDLRHLIDPAVTGRAPDAFRDVNRMIKEHEVRHGVHTLPDDGSVRRDARADRRELLTLTPDFAVATDARHRRRQPGAR